jgi:ABC-type phosphate transport system substrate-binding protein
MKKTLQLLIALIIFAFTSTQTASAQEVVVIINSENPSGDLSVAHVKYTYMRKLTKRWKDLNKNIIPVDRNGDSEIRKKFLKDVLQMTSDEFTRYFTERAYQYTEAPPVKLNSDAEIIAFVESNLGAIAFVPKSAIKSDNKVKVILTL